MKPLVYALAGAGVLVALAAGPVLGQGRPGGGGAPGGGSGGGGAVRAGGGGSSAPSGGGGASSGGGRAVSSSGSSSSGGSRTTYGGSSSGSSGYSGGTAVQRGGNAGYSNPTNGSNPAVRQVYGAPGDNAVPRGARPYGGATPYTGTIIGHAVPRQTGSTNRAGRPAPVGGGGGHDINWGYAPWLFAGLGFYDVLYADPYWLAGYWFPYTYGYDYDPYWDPAAEAAQSGYGYEEAGMGGLKLKVQPASAEVRVDGYYMGTVDEFNGVFQKMELAAGPHHVDIIAPGYRSIGFDVRIEPNDVVTYRGELQPLAKQ